MRRAKRYAAVVIGIMIVFSLAGFADAKTITLKLQSHLIPWDTHRGLDGFVDAIDKMSNGDIKIKLFGVGSIVPMPEMLNAVRSGALEMAMIPEGFFHKLVPVGELAGLPFAFRNIHEARYFMYYKGLADMLKEGYAKFNVYHLPFESYPVGIMSKKPLKTVEDFKGTKIRGYGVMAEWITQMGGSTVTIPGGELYTALATGVVEGAHWGDAGPMYIMKFHEILKNYMLPEPIQGAWNNLIINMNVWKKLTPVQQQIIQTAALAEGSRTTVNTRIIAETSLKKMVSDWDVKTNTVSKEDAKKMTDAAMIVWDKLAKKDPINKKVLEDMKDFLKELGYLR
jgi:TRAP-type C4-dicarboxylate transport system substrate-binding protein